MQQEELAREFRAQPRQVELKLDLLFHPSLEAELRSIGRAELSSSIVKGFLDKLRLAPAANPIDLTCHNLEPSHFPVLPNCPTEHNARLMEIKNVHPCDVVYQVIGA